MNDSRIFDARSTRNVEPAGRVYFPLPDLSRRIERDSARRVYYYLRPYSWLSAATEQWRVTWIMYEVIGENSHTYSHGLTTTSLMRKELCPSLTKWCYLTLLLTFNHVYCVSKFHIAFFLIGLSVTNIFGVQTSSWLQNGLLQITENKLKVERF